MSSIFGSCSNSTNAWFAISKETLTRLTSFQVGLELWLVSCEGEKVILVGFRKIGRFCQWEALSCNLHGFTCVRRVRSRLYTNQMKYVLVKEIQKLGHLTQSFFQYFSELVFVILLKMHTIVLDTRYNLKETVSAQDSQRDRTFPSSLSGRSIVLEIAITTSRERAWWGQSKKVYKTSSDFFFCNISISSRRSMMCALNEKRKNSESEHVLPLYASKKIRWGFFEQYSKLCGSSKPLGSISISQISHEPPQ